MDNKKPIDEIYYNLRIANNARAKTYDQRKEWEEFYYNDVERTGSQFTRNQMRIVENTYNIPISTKMAYPVVEQVKALLTASKPFPRLLANDEQFEPEIINLGKAYHAVWYESKADNVLNKIIENCLCSGLGYAKVRPNDFYSESTFGTIIDYANWKSVLVDPESKKADFSDADFMLYVDVMRKEKAEKMYDITITDDDLYSPTLFPQMSLTDFIDSASIEGLDPESRHKYVFIIEQYTKEYIRYYISDDDPNIISRKRPKRETSTNPEWTRIKEELDTAISEQQSMGEDRQRLVEVEESINQDTETAGDTESYDRNMENFAVNNQQSGQLGEQSIQIQEIIKQLKTQLAKTPKEIEGYNLITDSGEEHFVTGYTKDERRKIKKTLVVGKSILETEILPTDTYPIIPFWFVHFDSPNRVFGLIHYIIDFIKAMNKYWSMLIYDLQMSGQRKIIYFEGTVAENSDVEKRWAVPGAWVKIKPDPSLPNGGMPTVIEPAPINQSITYVLGAMKEVIEYTVGIYSLMQGNPQDAPNTFGTTMNLQGFGSQRIKLYSRNMGTSLEMLAKVTVDYLNYYAPKNKIIKYINNEQKDDNVQLSNTPEELGYKVRVDISNSLPTYKQMAAQLLSVVIAQTKNAAMSDLLTETMLELIDVPEAKDIKEKVDVVNNLNSQLAQLQEQLKQSEGMVRSLQQQIALKQISNDAQIATEKAKNNIALEENNAINNIQQASEEEMPQMPTQDTEVMF